MHNEIILARKYRDRLLCDPYRPAYHIAISDDKGFPADPNGAFFADGVYHLMHIYKSSENGSYNWRHLSSIDAIHWRHHCDALTDLNGDGGCYSGGAFVDDDGVAYLSFWKFPSKNAGEDLGGIALAYSYPPYEKWQRMEEVAIECTDIWGITEAEIDGETVHLGCADPSNIWKSNGKYYIQTGNLVLLDNYGRSDDSEEKYKGDFTDLFSSDDLKKWKYVGRFYKNPHPGLDGYPDLSEDGMCPSFLPLFDAEENGKPTGKYLQLFISHNKGCQYYIGRFEEEKFIPEQHGRMTWGDIAYFAPEALIDGKNRHIMWAWVREDVDGCFEKFGWSGVLSAPRNLWYENGELKMAPISELSSLEYGHIAYSEDDGDRVKVGDGELCRIKGIWENSGTCGVAVRVFDDGKRGVEIYYSPDEKKLIMDTTKCGGEGWLIREAAPFELRCGEKLELDIMIDKSVIEVYANRRQAICRRVYIPDSEAGLGVRIIGEKPEKLDTYRMFPSNPY